MPIDTAKVTGRRSLKFESPAALFLDASSLVSADHAGSLTRLGNWSLGQALGHLAAWINYAYDGYPPRLKAPWFVRLIGKFMKRSFLRKPLPVGFRLPNAEGGTFGTEPLTTQEGLNRFRGAWDRLRAAPPAAPNPVFGLLTHEEWTAMHLRHAELHLSFFVAK